MAQNIFQRAGAPGAGWLDHHFIDLDAARVAMSPWLVPEGGRVNCRDRSTMMTGGLPAEIDPGDAPAGDARRERRRRIERLRKSAVRGVQAGRDSQP